MRIIKLIFYGAPRAGKTTLRKQLLRHIEGKELLPCGNIEPSTHIAEVCTPIFVQRIAMTNEENNEWKWNIQKLDDMAKALLLCLDNKLLQEGNETNDDQETLIEGSIVENNVKQKPNIEQKEKTESYDFSQVEALNVIKEDASDLIHPTKQNPSTKVDLTLLEYFRNAIKTGNWAEVVGALNIDKAIILQIIDGGGQSSFQEIFPLLISGPSLTLLIFKLTDDLEALYPVQYQPKGSSAGPKAWEDTYIVKDIISHALSSFASRKETTTISSQNDDTNITSWYS